MLDFGGQPVTASLARAQVHRYTFSFDTAQIGSTAGDTLLLRVAVERASSVFMAATPRIAGLEPVARYVDRDRTVALYVIDRANTYVLEIRGATDRDRGGYRLHLDVAGDVNLDADRSTVPTASCWTARSAA